jgi:CRISPR-associated endoribonuclease Cas6
MYQLLLRLQATRDCAWERQYHRKIRGRLGQALQRAGIERYQSSNTAPFTFSDLMPAGDISPGSDLEAGDRVHLLVAASARDVYEAIATDLRQHPELTAGSMTFETRAAKPLQTGAGTVGDSGTLITASGVVVAVESAASNDGDGPSTYWTDRDHSEEAFKTALHRNVRQVIDHETDQKPPEMRLFDAHDHQKTYGVKLEVTPGNHITLIASKWHLGYEVRDERHRAHLNAVLGHGVGMKRSYGFGLLQRLDDPHHPLSGQTGTEEAV